MTASLTFSGTGLSTYTVPGTHTAYGGALIQYAADGASIFLPNMDSFLQLVDNAICAGSCSVESLVNWNNTFAGNEFGCCFIDNTQTGFSLIVTPTLVRLRNEVSGSVGSTISQVSLSTTGTDDVLFKVEVDLSTGAIVVYKDTVQVLTGTYSGTTVGLRAGLQVYHASDNPIHAYKSLNTVTTTTAKTITAINGGAGVRVGSTGNTISTLNMTTLTGITIGGKAMINLGTEAFDAPGFVDGASYSLLGSVTAVATDATGSANRLTTLLPPTGWSVQTLEAPLNTTTGVITGLSPAAQAGEQILIEIDKGTVTPQGDYQGDYDGSFQVVRVRLNGVVDVYTAHTVAPTSGVTYNITGLSTTISRGNVTGTSGGIRYLMTGLQAVTSRGTVTQLLAGVTYALTGLSTTMSRGNITGQSGGVIHAITGLSATASRGTISAVSGGVRYLVTGLQALMSRGNINSSTGVIPSTDAEVSVTKSISLNIFKNIFKSVSRKLYTKREK